MTMRSNLLSLIGLTIAIGGLAAFVAPQETKTAPPPTKERDTQKDAKKERDKGPEAKAKVGEQAPDFTLMDAAGKSYKLADYKGKIVVLQWINPGCPVCNRVAKNGLCTAMAKQLKEIEPNVVHLAINSTWNTEPATTAAYLKDNKIESPGLIDREGTVGKLYGAKTTPHVFVIDQKGVLRYQGAFDDDPQGSKGTGATNFVVQAVRQIVAGETVTPDTTKPYGCSVKYAPAKETGAGGH
jgi:peroxiredoxin